MRFQRTFIFALTLVTVGTCWGKTIDLATQKGFVLNGVLLEKTKLQDLIQKFGNGSFRKTGDAGNFLHSVCYRAKDGTQLRFGSGEMGAGEFITEILIARKGVKSGFVSCKKTSTFSIKTQFDNGLSLLSQKKELIAHLGKPKKQTPSKTHYLFQQQLKDGFVEQLTIDFKWNKKQELERIQVYKITVN